MVYLIEMSCPLLFVRRVDVTADPGQRGGFGLGCCGTAARAAAQADRPTYKLCPGGRRILSRRPQPRHRRITHSRSAEAVGQGGTVPHAALACLLLVRPVPQPGRRGPVDRRRGCDIDRVAGFIAGRHTSQRHRRQHGGLKLKDICRLPTGTAQVAG